MGSLFLLQGIFLTQELNQVLLHCKQILYQLSYREVQWLGLRVFTAEGLGSINDGNCNDCKPAVWQKKKQKQKTDEESLL